jgi:sugar/nucleoside kinase (ribokinase family)
MIARFEQLAGAYLFGLPAASANPDQVREAASAARLKTALAAWEVQAHRTLANRPDPAELVRVARVQALITALPAS